MKQSEVNHWENLSLHIRQQLDENQLTQCMRCGFCLPACPTYREVGEEAASPRGRIAWMKAVYDDLVKPDSTFIEQMNLCLGCRACEPACPAGVEYGRLLEQTRSAISQAVPQKGWKKWITQRFLQQVIPHSKRLKRLGKLLSFYQRSGMGKLLRRLGFFRLLPRHLEELEASLPLLKKPVSAQRNTRPNGSSHGRVALFHGCIMDVLFSETNQHTIELLEAAGYEVVIPPGQTCCGALHAHTGDHETAVRLAKQNIEAFLSSDIDWIATNAGGCGAMLTDVVHLIERDPDWKDKAQLFSQRVKDISDLLWERKDELTFETKVPMKITYQDSCHLRNGMKSNTSRKWLQAVKGAEYVELCESDRCCGSAGIYNLLQPDMSTQILDEKMEHVKQTGADWIITSNPGCLLQMKWGIQRAQIPHVQTMHLVDFLHQALKQPNKQNQP